MQDYKEWWEITKEYIENWTCLILNSLKIFQKSCLF